MTLEERQKALELTKKYSVREVASMYDVSPQHLYFLLKPETERKHLNKKRALLRKLNNGA